MSTDFDLGQIRPGAGRASAVERAESKIAHQREEIERLTARLDRLSLVCRAMWSFVQSERGVDEEALIARIEELSHAEAMKCESCGRTYHLRHDKCLYCGNRKPTRSAFDKV